MLVGMKRRLNPERMRLLLARRQREGWSWAELSRRTGHATWKLRWWHKRLARTARAEGSGQTFRPVRIVVGPRMESPPLEVVTPRGYRVLVRPGVAPEELVRVLSTLDRPC